MTKTRNAQQPGMWTAPVYEKTGYGIKVYGEAFGKEATYYHEGRDGELSVDCTDFNSLKDRYGAGAVFAMFDLYDGSISRKVINRIINACVSFQWRFLESGDVHDCRMMNLKDIESATGIDAATISRATKCVIIFTARGTYTLNGACMDIDHPSLFDDGARKNGKTVSRLEVVTKIRDIIAGENIHNPFRDQEIAELLSDLGYEIARRTVSKYREFFLGIPKCFERRIVAAQCQSPAEFNYENVLQSHR